MSFWLRLIHDQKQLFYFGRKLARYATKSGIGPDFVYFIEPLANIPLYMIAI